MEMTLDQLRSSFKLLFDKEKAWEDLHSLTLDHIDCVRQNATWALEAIFEYIPNKEEAWEDLHRLTLDKNIYVRRRAVESLKAVFQYVPDKEKAWKDLYRLTLDQDIYVRLWTVESLGVAFQYVPNKERAWEDLHKLTLNKDIYMRREAVESLGAVFQYVPDKEKAWKDLHRLTSDQDIYVRRGAVESLGIIFQYMPDKEKVWKDLHRLTSDQDVYVRRGAVESLGTVFEYIPDKEKAWKDLHRLISEDRYVRLEAVESFGAVFEYMPDKEKAWKYLHILTSDQDKYVRRKAVELFKTVFEYVPDKEKACGDLYRLALDQDGHVQQKAVESFGAVFQYIPDKEKAQEYLHRFTSDQDRYMRQEAVELFETVFEYIPDKEKACGDLYRLASDQDRYVQQKAVESFGAVFQYIPDKEKAQEYLHRLTSYQENDLRVYAYHSLGRISVYKASQSKSEEVYIGELENSIRFFEKSVEESTWWGYHYNNPSSFCLPFYRSFYTIIRTEKQQESKDEVEKYLAEAKNAINGSENKKLLFEAVENLSNALKEIQNLDLETKKGELNFYRKYCEQAAKLMRYTEKTAPFATITMRKGFPLLDRKLKSLLEEILEKAKTACRESKGTDTEEIACAVNKEIQKWEISSLEEMTEKVEDLVFTLKSKIPDIPENKRIFDKIEKIKHETDLIKQYECLIFIIGVLPQVQVNNMTQLNINIANNQQAEIQIGSITQVNGNIPNMNSKVEETKPTIGIITALPKEYAAVRILLENSNDKYKVPGSGAGRRYCLGEIPSEEGNKHSLVLANAGMGNNIAAARVSLLLEHFPNVISIIMVGIAGGVPNPKKADDHVRLGDIVISNENGVIQYDLIKQEIQEITHRNPPRPPSASLLEAVKYLEAEEILGNRPWEKYITQSLSKIQTFRPSDDKDILFNFDSRKRKIRHPEDPKRIEGQPRVFTGPIASANILQKDPKARDKLRDKFGVKAIEMEASGIADATWNHEVGYLVVRGICDYCDSHKNDEWQQYAAVVAAAYTRALIESMP